MGDGSSRIRWPAGFSIEKGVPNTTTLHVDGTKPIKRLSGERLLKATFVSYVRWWDDFRGVLYLTDRRLIFSPEQILGLSWVGAVVIDLSTVRSLGDRVPWWVRMHSMVFGAWYIESEAVKHYFYSIRALRSAWLAEVAELTGFTPDATRAT